MGDLAHSVLLVRSDGLDQAKHRVPRTLYKTKSLEAVIRPALHVQMLWCHGYDVCFNISDADFRKDTVNHVDALSRSFSRIYDSLKSLPRNIVLMLDNTSSNNKNQLMVKFFIKLVCLEVIETAYLGFPIKGHTHSPLDGLGGHAVVRTSNSTFDTADQLTAVYNDFMKQAKFEDGTLFQGAQKHDEAADWLSWINEIPLNLALITGTFANAWQRCAWMITHFYMSSEVPAGLCV